MFSDPTIMYELDWHEYTNRDYWRALRDGGRMKFKKRLAILWAMGMVLGQNIQERVGQDIENNIEDLQ